MGLPEEYALEADATAMALPESSYQQLLGVERAVLNRYGT